MSPVRREQAEANDETVFERSYGYDIARDHC